MRLSHAKKTLIVFLVAVMLMPGVYMAFRPAPVRAQLPNAEIFSLGNIGKWIGEAIVVGLETAVYKTLKSLAKSLAHKMVETALQEFATGKKGQEPFWSTKAWDKEMKDIGGKFLSFGLEGMAKGFEKGFNRSKKEDMTKNAAKLDKEGSDYRADSNSAKQYGLEKASADYGQKADAAEAKAKNIRGDVNQMNKNEAKRAEADRRGQEGGTSEEVASVLGFLCNPNANISFKISLGIGSLGEDPDVEPVCNVNDLAKNWGNLYDQFKTFDPKSLANWKTLGDLFDTESSDVGVAFNANTAFFDAHEKQVAAATMAEFIDKLTFKPEEDEAGNIKTPGDIVRSQLKGGLEKGQENSSDPVKGVTGKFVADAADIVGTFVDSLLSKGMNYLKQGLVRNIKQWQAASKDNEFNKLADTLEKSAKDNAAKAKLLAEKAKLDLAQEKLDNANAVLEGARAIPPSEEAKKEVEQAQAVVTRVIQEVRQAEERVDLAQAAVTAIANAPLQAINPAQAAVMDAVYNPDAGPSSGGIAAVRQYTATLTRVSGIDAGVMDVLSQLRSSSCDTSANACVLGDAFANAVQQKMTVTEAIDAFKKGENAGLNPNGVFGFDSQSKPRSMEEAIQPSWETNYPYNSLVVLRKYRVLPVSWEFAALYIRDHDDACGSEKSCTLQNMVDAFDDPSSKFFRLVDPNWVLKLPSLYCAVKGYGPVQGKTKDTEQTICKNDTNGDGVVCCDKSCLTKKLDGSAINATAEPSDDEKNVCLTASTCGMDDEERTVVRSEVCLDEQSCLEDGAQGKCAPKMYGYCLEEKKIWRFNGTQCKPLYASCDEFIDKSTKGVSYYLKDSIPKHDACNENTAGCAWYSTTRFMGANRTTGTSKNSIVKDWDSANKAYFTPKAAECTAQAEGCRGVIPKGATFKNFAPQSDIMGNKNGWCGGTEESWSLCIYGENQPTITWQRVTNEISPNGIKEPVGKITRKENGGGGGEYRVHLHKKSHGLDSVSGKTFTFSLWAKSSEDSVITLALGSDADQGVQKCAIGPTWKRCSLTKTTLKDYSPLDELRVYLYTQAGDTYVYGAQIEQGSFFSDYQGVKEKETYTKIAPNYYQCDDANNTVNDATTGKPFTKPSYRREECKPFTLHCAEEYVGCELYTPQEVGGFPIAATGPKTGCKEACAGLTDYSIQKTRIQSQLGLAQDSTNAAFIPTSPTVRQCLVSDAGCDEFTNVLTGAGAEKRDYFKEIRWCEKKPTDPNKVTVFYSPMGSNLGGYRLDVFTVQADSSGAPACFGTEQCDCTGDGKNNGDDATYYYNQFTNPNITTPNCRQLYVNRKDTAGFEAEYYQMDKLIYLTDDCTEYRRTLDGTAGNIYKITPSLSQTCPSSSARCREFRDPTAGNVVMVDYSNFEDNTADGWTAFAGETSLPATASNESESLGNHSLEMKNKVTVTPVAGPVTFEKNGLLLLGDVSYLAGLSIKVSGTEEAKVKMDILGFEDTDGRTVTISSASSTLPANTWRYLTFSFAKLANVHPVVQGGSGVRITVTPKNLTDAFSTVLLDSIIVKQASGVIYAVDDSWVLPDECVANPADKTTAKKDQIGCKLYADRAGAQAVFRDVERLCPNEMVGCKAYAQSAASMYLIQDQTKSCQAADAGCTAYGKPTLDISDAVSTRSLSIDTKTEDWITRYLKITPEEARLQDLAQGICALDAVSCKAFLLAGQKDVFFKNPGKKLCRWRTPTDNDINKIKNDSTLTSEQKNAQIAELKIKGVWYYKTCAGSTVEVACTADADCKNFGNGECTEKECTEDDDAILENNIPKICPSSQKTCRKIIDPECKTDETLRDDYGRGTPSVSCQREYYYLANAENKGECNGKMDVDGGCILFNDANVEGLKYGSSAYYADYTNGGRRGIPINLTDPGNSTSTNDANTLLKVRLDRTCKTWLDCAFYYTDPTTQKVFCTSRVPCNMRAEDGTCANPLFSNTINQPEKTNTLEPSLFTSSATAETTQEAHNAALKTPIPFASLTGMARPDFQFLGGWSTRLAGVSGHTSLFGWPQKSTVIPGRLNLVMSPADPVIEVFNSCRVRPRSDAPDVRYHPKASSADTLENRKFSVDSCKYENKKGDEYQGIEGYCLEPYPKFSDTYFGVLGIPGLNVAARSDISNFGFKGACLNWYPSDRTETQAALESSASATAAIGGSGLSEDFSNDDIYFCAQFSVREHEEVLKNTTQNPITVAVPAVAEIPGIGRVITSNAVPYRESVMRVDRVTEFTINENAGGTTKSVAEGLVTITNVSGYPKTYTGDLTTKDGVPTHPSDYPARNVLAPTTDVIARIVETCDEAKDKAFGGAGPTNDGDGKCANGTQRYVELPAKKKVTTYDPSPVTAMSGVPGISEDWRTSNIPQEQPWRRVFTTTPYECKDSYPCVGGWDAAVADFYGPNTFTHKAEEGACGTGKTGGQIGGNDPPKDECDGNPGENSSGGEYKCPDDATTNAERTCQDFYHFQDYWVGSSRVCERTVECHGQTWNECKTRSTVTCGEKNTHRVDKVRTGGPGSYGDREYSNKDGDIDQSDWATGSSQTGYKVETCTSNPCADTKMQAEETVMRKDRVTTVEKKIVKNATTGKWEIVPIARVEFYQGDFSTKGGTPQGLVGLGIDPNNGKITGRLVEVYSTTAGGYRADGTSAYADPQEREDTIGYNSYGGDVIPPSTITRKGTVETEWHWDATEGRFVNNCAKNYTEVLEYNGANMGGPSCNLTPKSEIENEEATNQGVSIPIPQRGRLLGKGGYNITAKATYRDVYCARVVRVAQEKKSVPFYSIVKNVEKPDWGGAKGKQLTTMQAGATSTGPIILKRTISQWRWYGSKGSGADRFGFTINERAAARDPNGTKNHSEDETGERQTLEQYYKSRPKLYNKNAEITSDPVSDFSLPSAPVADFKLDTKKFNWDWSKWSEYTSGSNTNYNAVINTRPDREREAILVALKTANSPIKDFTDVLEARTSDNSPYSGQPKFIGDATNGWRISLDVYNSKITPPPLWDDTNATYNLFLSDFDKSILNTLAPGTTVSNFNADDFDYASHPIPFAKVYEDASSSGVPGSSGRFRATEGKTAPRWFNDAAWPVRYPGIYNKEGAADSFSWIKIGAASAPIVKIEFYVDVDNDQLPLRYVTLSSSDVNPEDSYNVFPILPVKDEGDGYKDQPPCTSSEPSETPCKNPKFALNSYTFRNSKIDGNRVCIEAMDNWSRKTKICKTLKLPIDTKQPGEFSSSDTPLH